MAANDFVISSKKKIKEGAVGVNRPNSEAVQQVKAGSINALIDSDFYEVAINHPGYFSSSRIFRSAPIRISKISDIIYYEMTLDDSGSSGNNVFNVAVYDGSGAFVNNLFGSGGDRLLISGDNGTRILVGRNLDDATTFNVNTAGHTFQYGNLNLTTLNPGYFLVPFVESFSRSARSIGFRLKLREQ